MNRQSISFYLRVLISVSLIVFLLFWVRATNLITIISSIKIYYLPLFFVLSFLDRSLMAYKWGLLLKAKGMNFSFLKILKVYYIGTFLGSFLPSTIGGDIIKISNLNRDLKNLRDITSSVIVERLLGFFSLIIFAIPCMLILGKMVSIDMGGIFLTILGVSLILLILFFLSFNRSLITLMERYLYFLQGIRLVEKARQFYVSYLEYITHKRTLAVFCILSFIEVLLPIFAIFVVALALNIQISLVYFLLFIPFILVLSRVPISLSGLGIQEGLFIYFFSFVGVTPANAFSLGLVANLLNIIFLSPGGIFFLIDLYYSPRKELQLERAIT
ncbi:MAG: hypothetical protein A3G93_11790 [Nitrospinae bacterium RIFCSPLOWO2_12_FULL_45_22]|nr:MAG: hypothetical protein A3G93_11790 [Nitrospinae bacterium RIFCSPLOWO2_12_FULL_45_22]